MRIDRLQLQNFKCFKDREFAFHPSFNLIVGENAKGKTSLLDAISVATGSWFLGIRGYDTRHIKQEEVYLSTKQDGVSIQKRPLYPASVSVSGKVLEKEIKWKRTLEGAGGRTTQIHAKRIKNIAEKTSKQINQFEEVALPLISYYGTGRLWQEPRNRNIENKLRSMFNQKPVHPFMGYKNSVNPRCNSQELLWWITVQEWIKFREKKESFLYTMVKKAILECIEGGEDIAFMPESIEVMILIEKQEWQPFSNLSDGQRNIFAMIGDIAYKAATLNKHLGEKALKETTGVVLIDELDLHLHPIWQRHIIEDLRRTFPKIQFFATTHSPFLIQSLRSGEELVMLEGQPTDSLANLSIEMIATGIMGVENIDASSRYMQMLSAAKSYLAELDEAEKSPEERLAEYKKQLVEHIAPYADNPAFQAILEAERAFKLGKKK